MSSNNWSSLPADLLRTIGRKLLVYDDYIRFRAVCPSWRTSIPEIPTHLPCQFPWLMLPERYYNTHRRTFFTSNKKLHYLNLPQASYPNRRCGSSHGWLSIIDESSSIFLINPISGAKINLPPLSTFPNVVSFDIANVGREYVLQTLDNNHYNTSLREMHDDFIKKIVLSNSPSGGSYFVALAIIRRLGELDEEEFEEEELEPVELELAYCKSDQNSWTFIKGSRNYAEDVMFFNGLIYSVHKEGIMAVCDLNVSGDSPEVELIGTPYLEVPFSNGDMLYLVNAMGDLLLVTRILGKEQLKGRTIAFQVYIYDFNGINWELLTSLGDEVLFLGENSSLAFFASDYPGYKGNRIYFTDDFSKEDNEVLYGDHDMGIFNLEDGSIEPLPCHPQNRALLSWPLPVWVIPNPCS